MVAFPTVHSNLKQDSSSILEHETVSNYIKLDLMTTYNIDLFWHTMKVLGHGNDGQRRKTTKTWAAHSVERISATIISSPNWNFAISTWLDLEIRNFQRSWQITAAEVLKIRRISALQTSNKQIQSVVSGRCCWGFSMDFWAFASKSLCFANEMSQEAELSQTLQVLQQIMLTLCQCLFGFLPHLIQKARNSEKHAKLPKYTPVASSSSLDKYENLKTHKIQCPGAGIVFKCALESVLIHTCLLICSYIFLFEVHYESWHWHVHTDCEQTSSCYVFQSCEVLRPPNQSPIKAFLQIDKNTQNSSWVPKHIKAAPFGVVQAKSSMFRQARGIVVSLFVNLDTKDIKDTNNSAKSTPCLNTEYTQNLDHLRQMSIK